MMWAKRSPRSTSWRAASGDVAASGEPLGSVVRSLVASKVVLLSTMVPTRETLPPREHEVVFKVGLDQQLAHLLQLVTGGPDEMAHRDRLAVFGGQECRCQYDITNVSPGHLEFTRQERQVDVVRPRRRGREGSPPDLEPLGLLGNGKLDQQVQPPDERFVQVLLEVAGEDDQA